MWLLRASVGFSKTNCAKLIPLFFSLITSLVDQGDAMGVVNVSSDFLEHWVAALPCACGIPAVTRSKWSA